MEGDVSIFVTITIPGINTTGHIFALVYNFHRTNQWHLNSAMNTRLAQVEILLYTK